MSAHTPAKSALPPFLPRSSATQLRGVYIVPISWVRLRRATGAILVSFTDGGMDIGILPILLRRGAAVLNARTAAAVLGLWLNMAGGRDAVLLRVRYYGQSS